MNSLASFPTFLRLSTKEWAYSRGYICDDSDWPSELGRRQHASIKRLKEAYLNYQHGSIDGLQHLSCQGGSLFKSSAGEKPAHGRRGRRTDVFDQIQVLHGQ